MIIGIIPLFACKEWFFRSLNGVEVRNLSKFYGNTKTVNDISLSIGKGELFGLLGPNGSGKTTMIKMLTGQIRPTSGSLRVHGVNMLEDPIRVRELVGVIPEQETPPSFLTAEESLFRRKDPKNGAVRDHLRKMV